MRRETLTVIARTVRLLLIVAVGMSMGFGAALQDRAAALADDGRAVAQSQAGDALSTFAVRDDAAGRAATSDAATQCHSAGLCVGVWTSPAQQTFSFDYAGGFAPANTLLPAGRRPGCQLRPPRRA